MKSRLLHIADFRAVDLGPWIRPFVLNHEVLERELRRVTNPYIRWEPGTVVAPGDQVVCRLRSDCDRFNREKLRFVAGSGMFHRELEELSVGMAVGETRQADLPEGRVALTVTGVVSRVVPEPDDGMVQAMGVKGVSTLAEFRAFLLARQKRDHLESALYEPTQHLLRRVLEESEFVLFREDWQAAVERKLERCRVLSRQEGMDLEKMTPEQFEGRIPVKSYHELVALLQNEAWDSLRMYLLGQHFALTDGFSVSEEDYEAYIADYVSSWRNTPEQAREIDPYESYRFNEYASHAYKVLQEHVRAAF